MLSGSGSGPPITAASRRHGLWVGSGAERARRASARSPPASTTSRWDALGSKPDVDKAVEVVRVLLHAAAVYVTIVNVSRRGFDWPAVLVAMIVTV
jgi:hypothetical protein